MELEYKAIGKRIKIARIKADLTQEKLSEMIGVSPTHLSNIETGSTRVSLKTIVSIANALHITSDDLLCDNVIKAKVQIEQDIAAVLEDCDEYEIRVIRDMAGATKARAAIRCGATHIFASRPNNKIILYYKIRGKSEKDLPLFHRAKS